MAACHDNLQRQLDEIEVRNCCTPKVEACMQNTNNYFRHMRDTVPAVAPVLCGLLAC
jgi:hypothetical protein